MRQEIETLVGTLRRNAIMADNISNEMTRDIGLRAQDVMLAKISNAFANDLQKILDDNPVPTPVEVVTPDSDVEAGYPDES